MKQKVVYNNHKSICTFNFDFIKTTILNGMGVTGNIVGQVKIDFLNILPSFPSLPSFSFFLFFLLSFRLFLFSYSYLLVFSYSYSYSLILFIPVHLFFLAFLFPPFTICLISYPLFVI